MAKCSICERDVDSLKTAIVNNQIVSERCDKCIANFKTGAIYARKHDREWQKREYAKDTIQRYEGTEINPAFVEAYPEVARQQWGDEVLRDYGQKRKIL